MEILAALAGVAIVLVIYFHRQETAPETDAPPAAIRPAEPVPAPAPKSDGPLLEAAESAVVSPAVVEPVVDEAEIESARAVWQSTVADLEAVEAELEVLDVRFDAKETELAEMEAQGMDPDALEEEMLIFLDGIVDEYDQLESRLAEAEAAEVAAAERLAELQGDYPQP